MTTVTTTTRTTLTDTATMTTTTRTTLTDMATMTTTTRTVMVPATATITAPVMTTTAEDLVTIVTIERSQTENRAYITRHSACAILQKSYNFLKLKFEQQLSVFPSDNHP